MRSESECKHYEYCNAPMCPLDENLERLSWFPDEDICKNRKFASLKWIKTQKKIAKKLNEENKNTYFTLSMLQVIGIVGKRIKGCNPDDPKDTPQKWVETYLKKHKTGTVKHCETLKQAG